jgi:hypothetical protein
VRLSGRIAVTTHSTMSSMRIHGIGHPVGEVVIGTLVGLPAGIKPQHLEPNLRRGRLKQLLVREKAVRLHCAFQKLYCFLFPSVSRLSNARFPGYSVEFHLCIKYSYHQSGHRYVEVRSTSSPIMKAPSPSAYTSSMDGFSNLALKNTSTRGRPLRTNPSGAVAASRRSCIKSCPYNILTSRML